MPLTSMEVTYSMSSLVLAVSFIRGGKHFSGFLAK